MIRKAPPSTFAPLIDPKWIFGQHLQEVEELVLQLYENKYNNLSIQLPIRHGKTLYAIIIAFTILMHNPKERIIIASFSKDAAKEMLTKLRNAILEWGASINAITIDPNNCRSDYFRLSNGIGEARAVSIGTKFSHATANTIIVDDIYTEESARSIVQRKSIEEWFFGTLLNRRTPSERGAAKVISTMTPRHPEDILAVIENNNTLADKDDKWLIHRKSAINNGIALFPELWDIEKLNKKRIELEDVGKSYTWQTLWMCNPQVSNYISFDPDWIPAYGSQKNDIYKNFWYGADQREWLYNNTILKIVCCDPSITGYGDFTSIQTINVVRHSNKSLHLYLDKHYREQCFIPVARAMLSEIILRDRPDAASCESNGFQRLIAYDSNDEISKSGFLCKIRPFEPPRLSGVIWVLSRFQIPPRELIMV